MSAALNAVRSNDPFVPVEKKKKKPGRAADPYGDRPPPRDYAQRDNDRRPERSGRGGPGRSSRADRGDSAPSGFGRGRGRGGRSYPRGGADIAVSARTAAQGIMLEEPEFNFEPPVFDSGPAETPNVSVRTTTPVSRAPPSLPCNSGMSWASKLKQSSRPARRPPSPEVPPEPQQTELAHNDDAEFAPEWGQHAAAAQDISASSEQGHEPQSSAEFGSGFGHEPPNSWAAPAAQEPPAWPAATAAQELPLEQTASAPDAQPHTYRAPPGLPAASQAYPEPEDGVFKLSHMGATLSHETHESFSHGESKPEYLQASNEGPTSSAQGPAVPYGHATMAASNALETLFPGQGFSGTSGVEQKAAGNASSGPSAQHHGIDGRLGTSSGAQGQDAPLAHGSQSALEPPPPQQQQHQQLPQQAPEPSQPQAPAVQEERHPSQQMQVQHQPQMTQQGLHHGPSAGAYGTAPYHLGAGAGSEQYISDGPKASSPVQGSAGHGHGAPSGQVEHARSEERATQEIGMHAQLPAEMQAWGMQGMPHADMFMQRSAGSSVPGMQSMIPNMQQMPTQPQMGGQYPMGANMQGAPYGAPGFPPGYNAPQMAYPGFGHMQFNMPFNAGYPGGYQPYPGAQFPGAPQTFGTPSSGYGGKQAFQGEYQRGTSMSGAGGQGVGGRGTRGGRKPQRGRGGGSPGAEGAYGGAYGGYEQSWGGSRRYESGGYGGKEKVSQGYAAYNGGVPGYDPYYTQQQFVQQQFAPQGWGQQEKGYGKQTGF